MIALLIFGTVCLVGWCIGSLIAWYDYGRLYYAPFNWRLFLGPVVYINWAELKEEEDNGNDSE